MACWATDAGWNVCGFVLPDAEAAATKLLIGLPVMSESYFLRTWEKANLAIAIGAPKVRIEVASKFKGFNFPVIKHPTSILGARSTVGQGSILCPNAVISCDVKVGEFVIVNFGSTVGHDVILNHYCSIMPGVGISGGVQIGFGAYLGVGSVVLENRQVGSWAVVGAQAMVNRGVLPEVTAVGVPAQPLVKA